MGTTTKTYKTQGGAEQAAANANQKGANVQPVIVTEDMLEELGLTKSDIGKYVLLDATAGLEPDDDGTDSVFEADPALDEAVAGTPIPHDNTLEQIAAVNKALNPPTEPAEPAKEELTPEQVAELQARQRALKEELSEVQKRLATQQSVIQFRSAVGSPVALCREVFVAHLHAAGGDIDKMTRKTVIQELVDLGVALNTAKTQYQINRGRATAGELAEDLEALEAADEAEERLGAEDPAAE